MGKKVFIPSHAEFDDGFGSHGLNVGSRLGPDKRTQDDKEWYIVRRFSKEALQVGFFEAPLILQKVDPPEPDFHLTFDNGDPPELIEITEATNPDDQREMTIAERRNEGRRRVGEFGGRFSNGAGEPGRTWAAEVLDAITRKIGKSIFTRSESKRHLVIFPNSNASIFLASEAHERTAFGFLDEMIDDPDRWIRTTNGCLIHVLGGELVCFDLLGRNQLVPRHRGFDRFGWDFRDR